MFYVELIQFKTIFDRQKDLNNRLIQYPNVKCCDLHYIQIKNLMVENSLIVQCSDIQTTIQIKNVIQMPFEYQTIIGYLNSGH